MASIRYSGCAFSAVLDADGRILVSRINQSGFAKSAAFLDEQAARFWLGDHGLRRGKIKRLLNEGLRPEEEAVV